jgi:LysM repeat protein
MLLARIAPIAAFVLPLLTASPAISAPETEPHDDATGVDAPLSMRGTRGAPHPDCKNEVPLWEHVVTPGESLGLIAGRYGVRRGDLVQLNGDLRDPNLIRPGQKIRVCPEIAPRLQRDVVHEVAKGETLSHIAAKYDLTVRELLDRLGGAVKDRNHVVVGTKLAFPVDGGVVEEFLPPLPKPARRGGGGSSKRHARVNAQLSPRDGLVVKRPYLAYGTAKTIGLLERVVSTYRRRHAKAPPVHVGDISQRGGGHFYPHLSHHTGRDIDMGYVLRGADGLRTKFAGVNRSNLDVVRTWALVKAFLDTNEVVYIFMDYGHQKELYDYAKKNGVSEDELDELFQYPRGRGRNHGIVRHWKSHKGHFHVRFKH